MIKYRSQLSSPRNRIAGARVSEAEYTKIRKAAKQMDMSISGYVAFCIDKQLDKESRK